MARHLETFHNGVAQYVVTCTQRGCSWTNYTLVTAERAAYLDDAHKAWHECDDAANAIRAKRRDGIR